jgi:hypothetical protein
MREPLACTIFSTLLDFSTVSSLPVPVLLRADFLRLDFIIDIIIVHHRSILYSGRQTKITIIIMSRSIISIALIISLFASALAFAPLSKPINSARKTALSAFVELPPVELNVASTFVSSQASASSSALQDGLSNYLSSSPAIESSTLSLSLKDRPPPPTAEEIAEKKANFNFWFWGGGFVAPFLATIYYFGPSFWKY